jgi:membrane peptidoglycan carboxypeptidase
MTEHPHHKRSAKVLAMVALSAVAGLLVAVLALPIIGGIGVTAKASADFFNDLPSQLVVPPLPERSVLLDGKGNKFATLHGPEDRISVALSQIPTNMRQAIVAIEDRRFYEHHGIDYRGILRAAFTNQENGSVTQGGSTLTQQYVKNVLIESATTPAELKAARERSLQRKIREVRYALALEHKLTKDQILANYLNITNFGDGAYGVEAAAQHYFGIHSSQLNLVQSALLAGIVNSPTAYDPKLHPKAALDRRQLVLEQMASLHYISQSTLKYAKTFPLGLTKDFVRSSDGCEPAATAAFFCEYVRDQLLNDPKFGATYEARQRRLFEGGLTIQTSLDPAIQRDAQQAADTIIPPGGRVATAVVVLQPGTGAVLAMAINRVYADSSDNLPIYGVVNGKRVQSKDRVHTKYNLAIAQPGFQPGSTFKMFTLSAALEKGLSTSTTFNSPPCVYLANFGSNPPQNGQCSSDTPGVQAPFGQGYSNAGDSEACLCNMTAATSGSVNTYFVQLEKKVGVGAVRDMAQRLGVRSKTLDGPADNLGGSLTLGSHEVSPMDMATAYATIAAHGLRCYPKPIEAIKTLDNKPVTYTGPGKCQQVLAPGIADTVTSLLQGVITSGTGANNGQIYRPAAGKTGTTDNHMSAWFVGYIPQLVTAVWVGDPRNPVVYPLQQCYTPGCPTADGVSGIPGWPPSESVFGGDLPTKIWAATMRAASTNLPVKDFPPPDFQVEQGRLSPLPVVAGQSLSAATAALTAAGFTPVDGGGAYSSYPPGVVAYTNPGGGGNAPQGTAVYIFTSTGAPPPPPPPPPVNTAPAPVPQPTTKPKPTTKAPVRQPTQAPKPTAKAPAKAPASPKAKVTSPTKH